MLNIGKIYSEAFARIKTRFLNAFLVSLAYYGIIFGVSFLLNTPINFIANIIKTASDSMFIIILLDLALLVGSVLILIAEIPFTFAWYFSMMDIYRDKTFSVKNLFIYFKTYFKKSFCIVGRTLQKLIIPIILVIVSLLLLAGALVALGIGTGISISADEVTGNIILIIGIVFIVISIIAILASYVYVYIKSLSYSLVNFIAYDNPNMTAKEVVEESEKLMKNNKGLYFLLTLLNGLVSTSIIYAIIIVTCGAGTLASFVISALIFPVIIFSYIIFYENRLGTYVCVTPNSNNMQNNNSNIQN